MTEQGYIKLHRQLLDWEWYKNTSVKNLFIHCLLKANHKDNKWQGVLIKKGSFVTSYENLSIETGLTVRQVRTALDKLKMTNEMTIKTTNKYSIISMRNWDKFQLNDIQDDNQMTIKRQTNDKQMTTNKNDNNDKKDIEEKKSFKKPTLEEVKQYCLERKNKINAQYFIDYYESKGWLIGQNKMKNWKAAIRTWESRTKKEQKDEPKTKSLVEILKEEGKI